ncbi:restriction endonuclease subunit S [Ligilactobacillus salivarius]|uniref:restriction endonuclease subunit S n=1 Tax=Ligilactobacillus salivarius TaxID=1624 RepID=UPI003D2977CA
MNSGRDYKQLNSGNIPVYGTGGYMLSVNDKLSDTDAVGIGRKGTIDKPLYLKAPFWTVDTLFYCTSKENSDVKFIYLLFQIINWKRYDESTGVPSLSKNTISSIKTYVPKVKEQDHISKLFFSLDNTLQLHERKCEELALIKKALLQKLFPKKDEIKPEVRYENFSDAWEQRKLGEVVEMFNGDRGYNYPKDSELISEGIPFINAGDLKNGQIDLKNCKKISREKFNQLSGAKIRQGDILYCLRGTLGKNAIVKFNEGTVASSLVDIRPKTINGIYLFIILNSDIEYRQRILNDEGAAQPNLSVRNLAKFIIPVPKTKEQQKIGDFFNQIDTLITLHQCKLKKLRQLKKFLLQNMFI